MYTGIKHTHILVVVLFLLIYLIKTILLLTGKKDQLTKFTKVVKVPEMIISTAFLGTGIYLFLNSGGRTPFFYIKLAAVFASIPLAIIGFKKENKALAALSLILIIGAYGLAEMNKAKLKKGNVTELKDDTKLSKKDRVVALYKGTCQSCHGEKGDAQLSGAADLTVSKLSKKEVLEVITNGKGSMSSYSHIDEADRKLLAKFVMGLRK